MPPQVMDVTLQPSVALPPKHDTTGAGLPADMTTSGGVILDHHQYPQQQQRPGNAGGGGRERCPRCASYDTKFCYYNNYNTAQPRHFCRACRRYWTLGGSLRNVPIGGSTRKRPRPARPSRAAAAACPFTSTSQAQAPPQTSFLGSLISSPLLALGAPLLEGRLGFDLGLGLPGPAAHHEPADEMGLGFGLRGPCGAPLLWPSGFMEHDPWKVEAPAVTAAMWQELAAATPAEGGGLHHGAQLL